MKYSRPPFPIPLWEKFTKLAVRLGYTVRGHRWKLLDMLLDYASEHPNSFRKR